jgi:hypothetical protein
MTVWQEGEGDAMPVTTPDWLTRHDGTLRLNPDGQSWSVLIGGEPLYRLTPVPVKGKFACEVTQTNNGSLLAEATAANSSDDAIQAALEELRKLLGW